jgi:hypothetical protein
MGADIVQIRTPTDTVTPAPPSQSSRSIVFISRVSCPEAAFRFRKAAWELVTLSDVWQRGYGTWKVHCWFCPPLAVH